MSYLVKEENLNNLESYWHAADLNLIWPCIFVLPPWLKAWWEVFGEGHRIYLRSVRQDNSIIGIAPLKLNGETASFIGSADVCDYLDFVIAPGHEAGFFNALLDDFSKTASGGWSCNMSVLTLSQ